jgi:hypothetical protein
MCPREGAIRETQKQYRRLTVLTKNKLWWLFGCIPAVSFSTQTASASMPCSELKAKIEDGLKAKGVQSYSLTVIPTADATTGKVVGSCEGGTQKIVYSRDASPQPAASTPAPAPAAAAQPSKKPAAAK